MTKIFQEWQVSASFHRSSGETRKWLALFAARGMSLESMPLRAACRTYAVLVADGRPAILALVF